MYKIGQYLICNNQFGITFTVPTVTELTTAQMHYVQSSTTNYVQITTQIRWGINSLALYSKV
jgi:hypothetical protein